MYWAATRASRCDERNGRLLRSDREYIASAAHDWLVSTSFRHHRCGTRLQPRSRCTSVVDLLDLEELYAGTSHLRPVAISGRYHVFEGRIILSTICRRPSIQTAPRLPPRHKPDRDHAATAPDAKRA